MNLKMRNDKKNVIVELTFDFSIKSVLFCELLELERKFVIARQLLKSSTSIGANIREAQNAESKADFIHKFKIAAKEIEETIYWLELCKYSKGYPKTDSLIEQLITIARIVNKIIITSKQK